MAIFQDNRFKRTGNWLGKIKQVFATYREKVEEYKIS